MANKSENVAKFKYFGITASDQNGYTTKLGTG